MIKFVLSNLILISIATASTLKVPSQYSSIQAAIDASTDGDTVSVAAGTYVENISYSGKSISIIGEDRETTIIDGDSSGIVVSFISGEDSSAVLRGFTITNGFNSVGAGIYVESSSPTLTDLIISRNTTGKEGGQPSGGGISLRYSSSSIDNVIFEDNYAYYQGGGIETRHSDILLTNSIFRGNYGGANSGAGWFGFSSDVTIENVLATDNEAHYGYGAFGIYSNTDLYLINATLTDNESASGDALGVSSTSKATVLNCIFYNNRDHDGKITGPIRLAGTNSSLDIQYSDVQGGQDAIIMNDQSTVNWGNGNIDTDPLFVDPDSGDYHLSDWSPAIGAGRLGGGPTTDIEGNPRPNPAGSKSDMGAFENKWGTSQSPPVITEVSDVTINEDESHVDTLSATDGDNDPITYSATSDTNAVTASITDSILTITPNANWNGVANIKAYASDGNSKDSTSFVLTVTSVQDAPAAFEWVSSALDSINITKDNVRSDYTLKWTESVDVDNDTIDYIMYAKIGIYPFQEIYDTTALTLPIPYEEIAESAFEGLPGNAATVRFTVWAHDGIDSVQVSGEDRVLYVNRYEYLSTESEGVPVEFALHENYPNPFNPTTQIRFDLPEMANVNLIIYNMLGQKIKSFNIQSAPTGYHAVTWNATNDLGVPVSAGIYLYQLQTEGFIKTKKMILLK